MADFDNSQSHVDQGAFLHNMPVYLRWWYPLATLPPIFHRMTLAKFQNLIQFLITPCMVSGCLSHPTLLAMGLIYRELQAAQIFSEDEARRAPVLSIAHYNAYMYGLKVLGSTVSAAAAAKAVTFPADFTEDKNGYIIAKDLPETDAEHGSPWEAGGGTRASTAKYIGSLSNLAVFQHAVGVMNKVIPLAQYYGPDIEIFVCRRRSTKGLGVSGLHPHSLGYGQRTMLGLRFTDHQTCSGTSSVT